MNDVLIMSKTMTVNGAAPPDDRCWKHRFVQLESVRLHYVEAGAGPLVVLLHGFPELWYAWRRQIPALAAAGFRVIAPDLRGFNLSDKPRGIASYGIGPVVEDIRVLIESAGAGRASVVGHDIGAVVAWALAMRHRAHVDRIAILNGPHPMVMLRGLLHPLQLLASWYVFMFQLPWLPELLASRKGHALLMQPLDQIPGAAQWASHERDAYRRAFAQPGALRAMINYYRALLRPSTARGLRRVDAPVLVLWGDRDAYLRPTLARPGRRWAADIRVEHLPDVGHFIQHERPDLVNDRLITFLREDGAANVQRTPP